MDVVTVHTIGWRYIKSGHDLALYELPRSGNPRLLSEKQANQSTALVCSSTSGGYNSWTLELLVKKAIEKNIVSTVGRETIRFF